MVYEEDLEEEFPQVEIQETISEKPVIEEFKEEQIIEEIDEVSVETPEPEQVIETKKVRVGGFFGKEITIDTKNLKSKTLTEIPESIETSEELISITSLKPPKRRGTVTIKLCKICGATIQNTPNCPTCGAKID